MISPSVLAAVALALCAAPVGWIAGRRIERHVADPLFAERLFAHRVTLTRVYLVLAMVAAVLARWHALWVVPLLIVAATVGGHPSRRAIYDDATPLLRFLADRLRILAGSAGFWIALAATPAILAATGESSWPFVAAGLFLCFVYYQDLLVFALAGAPLEDPSIDALLEPVLAAASVSRPRLLRGGALGSRWANAFALPRGKHSRILLSRALLEGLTPDELKAIVAHEVAHLEEYARPGVRWRVWLGFLLIPALAVIPQVIFMSTYDEAARWWPAVWPFVFAIGVLGSLMRRQRNETIADLRALELGAGADALIGGLEKIHAINRMPRRFDVSHEQRMSHPSLARRIQAIRRKATAAGGAERERLTAARVFATRDADRYIRFGDDALQIFEGVPGDALADESALDRARTTRGHSYGSLTALHVRHTARGPVLIGRGGGAKLELRLREADSAAIQGILDFIDIHLAEPEVPATRRRYVRLLAGIALLVALLPGIPFPAFVAALATVIQPAAATLYAFAAAGVLSGTVALFRDMPAPTMEISWLAIAVIFVSSLISLFLAAQQPPAERHRGLKPLVIVLGIALLIAAVPFFVSIFLGDFGPRVLHIARHRPSIPIYLASIAAGLAAVPGRRKPAGALAIFAVIFGVAGTTAFGVLAGADALLTSSGPVLIEAPPAVAVRKVSEVAHRLRISPGATSYALGAASDEGDEVARFEVGRIGGPATTIDADDVGFIDDTTFLRARVSDSATVVERLRTGSTQPDWGVTTPLVWGPRLSSDGGRWRLAGYEASTRKAVRYSGVSGSPAVGTQVWPGSGFLTAGSWSSASDEVVISDMKPYALTGLGAFRGFLELPVMESRIWRAVPAARHLIARTYLGIVAIEPVAGTTTSIIVARDGDSTHVVSVDARTGRITPHGRVAGMPMLAATGAGPRVAIAMSGGEVVLWNLRSNKATRLRRPGLFSMPLGVALADDAAGVAWMSDRGNVLEIYSTASLN